MLKDWKLYRPWKGFLLFGIFIFAPLAAGIPRYWSGLIAFSGLALILLWSQHFPGYAEDRGSKGVDDARS